MIDNVIKPILKDLGDNFNVRRALPFSLQKMVGPFIFWDHMGPVSLKKEMVVRSHPHIGLATITWLFSGEILHRDSLGNEQSIIAGEVNWMTSGSGIVHSERSFPKEPEETLEGIQLWLALPRQYEDVDANFYHCKQADVPHISTENYNFHLIAGEAFGQRSPVPVYSDLFYLNGEVSEATHFIYDLKENHEGALYIIDGTINIGEKRFERFDLITFKIGTQIEFKTTSRVRIMLFGGEVFPEKRYMYWNFVSSSKSKIDQAKTKWREGLFPKVINETEFIPLPKD